MADPIKTCSPGVGQDEYYVGLKRLMLVPSYDEEGSGLQAFIYVENGSVAQVPRGARNPTPEEAEKIHNGDSRFSSIQDGLEAAGLQGLCSEADGKEIKIFAYTGAADRKNFLALHNKCDSRMSSLSFDMHPDEVKGLAALQDPRLGKGSICCMDGFCPTINASTQHYTIGSYIFTPSYALIKRLTEIVEGPSWWDSIWGEEEVKIEGWTDDRREELAAHLERVTESLTAQVDAAESGSTWNPVLVIAILLSAVVTAAVAWPQLKQLIFKMKLENYTRELKRKLAKNPNYGFKNREAEAREVLKLVRGQKPRIILTGLTGAGKDILFKAIALLVLKGDEAVPERWRGAPTYILSPLKVQAGTWLRGSVADKIKAMIELAKKGPVVVYMPEIDHVLLSGATGDGTENGTQKSEMPVNLLLRELTDNDVVRENLLLIGSTSREDELTKRDAEINIVRRFWWHNVHVPTLGEVVLEIAEGFVTKAEIEGDYDVRLSNEVIDLAARIAEQYYRKMDDSGVLGPRFDAIIDVLESASSSANDRKARDVTEADVLAAIKKLRGVELSEAEVSELKGRDIDSLMIDESTPIARYAEHLKTIRGVGEKVSQLPDEARLEIAGTLFERWRTLDPVARGNLIGAEILIGGSRAKDGQPTDGFTRMAIAEIVGLARRSQMLAETPSEAGGADAAARALGLEALLGAAQGGRPESAAERIIDAARKAGGGGNGGGSGKKVGTEGVDANEAARRAYEAAKATRRASETVGEAGKRGRAAAGRK